MCILCMQRTLYKGQIYGMVSGLGIATADAVYGSIAGYGLTLITNFLVNQQGWVRLIGGLFLIYLGLKTVITKPAERAVTAKANGYFGAYASTLLLTLTNPLTILSFAAIFAGIGVGGANKSSVSASTVVLGVFTGSTLWWCILTSGISLLRRKFTPQSVLCIHRISRIILILLWAFALISLKR